MKKLFLTTIMCILGIFTITAQNTPLADVKATLNDNSNVDVIWSWNKIIPETIVVDFETGNLSQADFVNDANAPWVITDNAYEGTYAIKSSCEGIDNGKSTIEITVDVPFDGVMSFYHKSSCEQFFDNGYFYIDGVQKAVATGNTDWSYREYKVKKGLHTYKWSYEKDGVDSYGLDAYFVDNIVLYKHVPPFEGGWIHYDEGEYSNAAGSETGSIYWGISFPDTESYAGYSLTKLAYYDKNAGNITAKIYFGGETAPETLVHTQSFAISGSNAVVELELNTPVDIDGTQPLWITFYSTDDFPATACYHVGDSNSDWISFNDVTWNHTVDYGIPYTWIIRGFLENSKGETVVLGQQTTDNRPQTDRDFMNLYNVYRTNVHTDEIVTLAENVSDTTFVDDNWNTLGMGAYKWGASAIYSDRAESEITWSNTLDKDMFTPFKVVVKNSVDDNIEGAKVIFTNIEEPGQGYDYNERVGADGSFEWDSFRKGTYSYTVMKKGYDTLYVDYVEIWDEMTLECTLTEILAPVENLFVSATGWAMWENKDFSNGGGEFFYDFDDGSMEGWETIDADGDGFNWRITTDIMGPGYGYEGSRYCVISQSYDNDSIGPLTPDNYLVTSEKYLIKEGSQLSFYVCAQEASWAAEHYGIAVSTTGNSSPEDFTMIWEETLTGKSGEKSDRNDPKEQGAWYLKKLDLSEYAEQEIYIAFRHFNCTDQFYIDIDNICLVNETKENKELLSYDIYLDGELEATVTTNYYQHNVENLDNTTHSTKVVANYSTGESEAVEALWTYESCDNFDGAVEFTGENFFGRTALNWVLPGQDVPEANDSFFFDFEDGTLDGWNTIDADGDYLGWRNTAGYMEPGYGYDGSQHYAMSESFNNAFGGALTPDNYLVTSEKYLINEDTELSFYVCAQDESYPNEHYGVVISTTGNTSADDFATIWEETFSVRGDRQTKWVRKTINLGDYAGRELYIGLRHFNCTDQYILDIDNVELSSGSKGGRGDDILGVMVFRGEELLTMEPIATGSFVEEFPTDVEEEYCIRVVYQDYAMSCEQCVTVDPVNVEENNADNMSIYPNPTDGILNIEVESMKRITIFNAMGQVVYDNEVVSDKETIDMTQYQDGMYLLRVTTENGVMTEKVVR